MDPPEVTVVEELLGAIDSGDYQRVLALLSDECFSRSASGRIYIGRVGLSNWIRDTSTTIKRRWFEAERYRAMGDGFVLVTGSDNREPIRGPAEAVPGTWLFHVNEGRVTASMYFRTEREAESSLGGAGRRALPADVLEQAIAAFNAGDYAQMLTHLHNDIRVSSFFDREVHQGLAEVLRIAVTDRERFGGLAIDILDVDELGDGFCVVEGRIATGSGDETAEDSVAWLGRVVDGLIVEMILHDDAEQARLAAAIRTADAAAT